MISVIVTTYNQEKTIGRALDSVLSQRCHLPVEVIIGEDCSTDHAREICQEYATRYPQIRLFCNDHNKGIVDNYFDCLLACQGDYIADCAGDDFWIDDQKLEKASRLMEADSSTTTALPRPTDRWRTDARSHPHTNPYANHPSVYCTLPCRHHPPSL